MPSYQNKQEPSWPGSSSQCPAPSFFALLLLSFLLSPLPRSSINARGAQGAKQGERTGCLTG